MPPIQTKKIPEILFYNPKGSNVYRMIGTKKTSFIGEMYVTQRNELYIQSFNIWKDFRRQDYGKKFINFAILLSKKMGLNGNLRVMAGLTEEDVDNPSHIFYRKCGFTSDNKEMLEKIDECIKKGTQLRPFLSPPTIMYYINKPMQNKN